MTPFFISHELYLVYNPATDLGRKTHALAGSLNNVIHELDVMNKSITPLRWKEIIDMLKLNPSDLLNANHPDYEKLFSGKNYSEEDLLEIIFQNPQLIKGPIGILHNKAILCDDPKDILGLDLTPGAEKGAYH